MESKQAVTSDGSMIGLVRGLLVDPENWTVPYLVVSLSDDALDELKNEDLLKGDLVTIPTRFVERVSYMVQLNTELPSLSASISPYTPEEPEEGT